MTRYISIFLPAVGLVAACAGAPMDPPNPDEVVISVRITGSIAGIDRTITLDGPSEAVRVCDGQCSPPPGQIVRRLDQEAIRTLVGTFVDAGARSHERRDFGLCEQCADQRHFVLLYRDRSGVHRLTGDEPNFPPDLLSAVRDLEATTMKSDS